MHEDVDRPAPSSANCPHASFTLPWDDADAPAPVDALRSARTQLGDTFTLVSGEDRYLFLFSDEGLRSFYGVAERDASKGLADYRMLLRKLPPELFDGRRTFAHPETIASVRRSDHSAERAALGCVEHVIGEALDAPGRSEFLSRISKNWDGVAEPDRTQGIARDVVLLHVATMTNLVAALGWTMVRVLHDGTSAEAVAAGDVATVNRCALESIRLGQRSIMMRTVLSDIRIDDGATVLPVERGTILATMLPITNTDPSATVDGAPLDGWSPDRWIGRMSTGPAGLTAHEQVTTFGHGSHRCPARRFSMSAICMSMLRLFREFDLSPGSERVPGPLTHQIGGVGRAADPCPISYRRRSVTDGTVRLDERSD